MLKFGLVDTGHMPPVLDSKIGQPFLFLTIILDSLIRAAEQCIKLKTNWYIGHQTLGKQYFHVLCLNKMSARPKFDQ